MNYIKELYNGTLIPEDKYYSTSEEYKKIDEEVGKLNDALERLISESNIELLEKFIAAQDKLNGISNYENFERGFKIGMGIAFDVIQGIEKTDET